MLGDRLKFRSSTLALLLPRELFFVNSSSIGRRRDDNGTFPLPEVSLSPRLLFPPVVPEEDMEMGAFLFCFLPFLSFPDVPADPSS